MFKKIDVDSDNFLSKGEVSSYLKQQIETIRNTGGEQGEEAKKMSGDQIKLVNEIFAYEDRDLDGFISYGEFSGPKHDNIEALNHVKRSASVKQRQPVRADSGIALARGAVETSGVINQALTSTRGWTPGEISKVKAAVET